MPNRYRESDTETDHRAARSPQRTHGRGYLQRRAIAFVRNAGDVAYQYAEYKTDRPSDGGTDPSALPRRAAANPKPLYLGQGDLERRSFACQSESLISRAEEATLDPARTRRVDPYGITRCHSERRRDPGGGLCLRTATHDGEQNGGLDRYQPASQPAIHVSFPQFGRNATPIPVISAR